MAFIFVNDNRQSAGNMLMHSCGLVLLYAF